MTVIRSSIASIAAIALAATATAAGAETASQLQNINGAAPDFAESEMEKYGFSHKSSHDSSSNGYTYSYWWDGSDDHCVRLEEWQGRVVSVVDASKSDCGKDGGDAGAAVAVVAGAAILGALLSHKSHHHDDDKHMSDQPAEASYERGYTDGLHNASYHNYDRNDAYSSGYQAGVDEREANLRHHQGRGGYAQAASFSDLQDARAAGAMSEMERRGFRQVDNFTSGNTRYSIQWRPQSRQCVQMTIADGRIYDVRDIGQNPNCR